MKDHKILQSEEPAGASLQYQPNSRQRILVVEDDPDMRRLNSEVLTCFGYRVDTAEDGAAAWDKLQLIRYDLLITDNSMPKMSGTELLQKIWAARLGLPVIMATGTPPPGKSSRHLHPQVDGVLLKPYAFDDLLGMVINVLHVAANKHQEITPPPNWQSQPHVRP